GIGDLVWRAVFCDAVYKNSNRAGWTTFVNLYRDKFGKPPHFLPAIGYDSMRIVQQVMAKSNAATREALRDEVHKLKDFPGATGRTSFVSGDVDKELHILSIERSKADVNKYEIQPAKMDQREPPEADTDEPSEEDNHHDEESPPSTKAGDEHPR